MPGVAGGRVARGMQGGGRNLQTYWEQGTRGGAHDEPRLRE